MSCLPSDLKDYFFGELDATARAAVDQHVKGCADCRNELETLRQTRSALAELRDEEIPRRIAFVSDRVYEPSRLRRWWRSMSTSAPKLAFASAAMLAAAVVTHGVLTRPQAPAVTVAGRIDEARLDEAKLREMIRGAVAESEARQSMRIGEAVSAVEKNNTEQRQRDAQKFSEVLDLVERQMKSVVRTTSYSEGN